MTDLIVGIFLGLGLAVVFALIRSNERRSSATSLRPPRAPGPDARTRANIAFRKGAETDVRVQSHIEPRLDRLEEEIRKLQQDIVALRAGGATTTPSTDMELRGSLAGVYHNNLDSQEPPALPHSQAEYQAQAEPPREQRMAVQVEGEKLVASSSLDPIGWLTFDTAGQGRLMINKDRTLDEDTLLRWERVFDFRERIPERAYRTTRPAVVDWDTFNETGVCRAKGEVTVS